MEKWVILGLRQKIYRMSMKYNTREQRNYSRLFKVMFKGLRSQLKEVFIGQRCDIVNFNKGNN